MEMVEVKTSDLIGAALDWAVAKAQGWLMVRVPTDIDGNFGGEVLAPPDFSSDFKFPNRGRLGAAFFLRRWSADWAQGGPLIEKYAIKLVMLDDCKDGVDPRWSAEAGAECAWESNPNCYMEKNGGAGQNTLVAACRAIVTARLGDTVQVPKELMP